MSRTIFVGHKKAQHMGWAQIWCFDSHFVYIPSTLMRACLCGIKSYGFKVLALHKDTLCPWCLFELSSVISASSECIRAWLMHLASSICHLLHSSLWLTLCSHLLEGVLLPRNWFVIALAHWVSVKSVVAVLMVVLLLRGLKWIYLLSP